MQQSSYRTRYGYGLILSLLVAAVLVLAGCGSGSKQGTTTPAENKQAPVQEVKKQMSPETKTEQPTPKPAAPKANVVITFPSTSDSIIPVFVAREKGFFAEENLEVELVEMQPNAALASLTSKGEIDFVTALSSSASGAAKGLPVRTTMIMMGKPSHRLVAREEIKQVSDLRGKAVAIGSIGALMHYEFMAILEAHNIPFNQVEILAVKGEAARVATMDQQAVAGLFSIGGAQEALKIKGSHILIEAAEVFAGGVGGMTTSIEKMQNERDKVKRTLRAVLKAQQYMKTHREETIKVIEKDIGYGHEEAATTYDLVMNLYTSDGIGDDNMHKTTAKVAQQMGEIKETVTPEMIFDFTIMKEIVAETKK